MRRPEVVLETELLDLLETGRNARITARRYGFDGRVAKACRAWATPLVTRERVRHDCEESFGAAPNGSRRRWIESSHLWPITSRLLE